MKSLYIGKIIYNTLIQNTQLQGKVDKKIYPLVADKGTTFPFIVYRRESITPSSNKDSIIYDENAVVNILIASDSYSESVEIASLVADSLSSAMIGKQISGITIEDIRLENTQEDFSDDTFLQILTYNIKIKN